MFRFENGDYLYALILIPILIGVYLLLWQWRKRSLAKLGNTALIERLAPDFSKYKQWFKFGVLALGLSFLIIGWSNPQWGTRKEKVKRKSIDVFLALDISNSMMAKDIAPNRLDRCKNFTRQLIEELKGEQIGLILFAGNAYLQMPLTNDYAAAELFVRSANTGLAPAQGTAIAEAIDLAEESFDEKNKSHKVLILLSDGENHDDEAIARAQEASDNGLLIYTIGVGTTEGDYIPYKIGGRMDYKRDERGSPVKSAINEELMKQLASAGNGEYYNIVSGNEIITALKSRLESVEKRELEERSFSEFESYFQYFLFVALILLILEYVIPYTKSGYITGRDLFGVK